MAKRWELYKSEIHSLYIADGRPLDDVRRILKGRHNFDASSYRMKLEEWGMKKNKVATSLGHKLGTSRSAKTTTKTGSNLTARTSNTALYQDRNITSLPSVSALQFPNPWTAPLNFSDSLSHDFNSSNVAATETSHDRSTAEYVDITQEVDFASRQSLFNAISNGVEDEVTKLLSTGTSVHVRDGISNSPLHAAILKGNIVIVKSLLNYGANIDAIGFKRKTPLHLAIASKPLVQLLLNHSPTLSLQDDEGNTALHYLLNTKDWWVNIDAAATMKSILSSGMDINITNRLGESPLHRVVSDAIPESNEYMELASEFLDHNPDVTSPMRNGLALLSMFLNKSEIFVSPRRMGYWRPPSWVETGYQCLEKFLVAGADPNTIFRSKPLIIEYLLNGLYVENDTFEKALLQLIQKANIDVMGPAGNYPLHLTLGRIKIQERYYSDKWSFGVYAIAAALISRNASVNQTNDEGVRH
ncbi:hypothetical protein G7Y89_g3869 [Cudoniella acicularis]|uniref:Clr5 domain-containing protein n=1 Tax=Cudoniella acicularis TaxID=354080 RepID=A0A8H4W7Z2_9HELO|nr:hypothetical protein G7Y89_g3869 [Cudoniella acicularis]